MVIWCRWDGTLWYSRVAPLLLPYGSDFTGTQFHSLLLGSRPATTTVWSENRSIDSLRKATQETWHNHWNAAEMKWNPSLTMKGIQCFSNSFSISPNKTSRFLTKLQIKQNESQGLGLDEDLPISDPVKRKLNMDLMAGDSDYEYTPGSEDLMDSSWVILFEVMPKKLVGNA